MKASHPDNQDTADFILTRTTNRLWLTLYAINIGMTFMLVTNGDDISLWLTQ